MSTLPVGVADVIRALKQERRDTLEHLEILEDLIINVLDNPVASKRALQYWGKSKLADLIEGE